MIIISLDISLKDTGICLFLNNQIKLFSIKLNSKKNNLEKMYLLGKQFDFFLKNYLKEKKIDTILYESFISQFGRTNTAMLRCQGILLSRLFEYTKPTTKVYSIMPLTLKKELTGNHKASKDEIRAKIKEVYGVDIANDNQADAYGILKVFFKNKAKFKKN